MTAAGEWSSAINILELSRKLIADTCTKQGINSGQPTLHADRGSDLLRRYEFKAAPGHA